MTDILIKNIELPKGCGECPMSQLVNDNQYAFCHLLRKGTKVGYKLTACPLVEVPPHGRLVDADKAIDHWNAEMMVIDRYSMRQFLDRIPTVLEANNGSDN